MSYYPSEIHFIFELQLQIERYFPKATFHLMVDTSFDDGTKSLHFVVENHWETSAREAMAQLDKFNAEWYLANMYRAKDVVIIQEFSKKPKK